MRKKYVLAFGFIYLLFTFFFFYADIQAGEIKDAESAKHGEDASRYRIVDTYPFPGFKLIQFRWGHQHGLMHGGECWH